MKRLLSLICTVAVIGSLCANPVEPIETTQASPSWWSKMTSIPTNISQKAQDASEYISSWKKTINFAKASTQYIPDVVLNGTQTATKYLGVSGALIAASQGLSLVGENGGATNPYMLGLGVVLAAGTYASHKGLNAIKNLKTELWKNNPGLLARYANYIPHFALSGAKKGLMAVGGVAALAAAGSGICIQDPLILAAGAGVAGVTLYGNEYINSAIKAKLASEKIAHLKAIDDHKAALLALDAQLTPVIK